MTWISPRRALALAALTMAACGGVTGAAVAARGAFRVGDEFGWRHGWPRHRIPVGASPQVVALDAATRTLYVTNSNEGSVSVVDAACANRRASRCGPAATKVQVGNGPFGIAIDERTNTIYVVSADSGTVSVIDGVACNARHPAGCAQTFPTVAVEGVPFGIALNQTTGSIYVGNLAENVVSIINARTCNRTDLSGCGRPPALIPSVPGPVIPSVDEATNTIYVPDGGPFGDGSGSTMSVIDGRACNAATTSGCGQAPATVNVGLGPSLAFVDDVTHTVYVSNSLDGTVSVVDAATCNGRIHSGCGQTPPVAPVGGNPGIGFAIDRPSQTLYVVNGGSDTLSAVAIAHCRALDTSRCARTSRTLQVGEAPQGVALDPSSRTLFVVDSLVNDLFLFNAADCNTTNPTGCRKEATTVATGGARDLAVAAAVHTLYVTQPGSDSVAMIDTRLCNAAHLFGCGATPAHVALGVLPVGIVVDPATHTIYLNNMGDGTVSVIDAATCNVSNRSSCTAIAQPIPVGNGNAELALNPSTHTVYVANGGDNTVSVIDAGHCNAMSQSGCGSTPASVAVGGGPRRVGIDSSTNTIYVSNFGGGAGHTISVIDGSGCDAATAVSCGQTPATITVGLAPQGLVVDQSTHTLYVANQAFNDEPGTVSIVNAAICNAAESSGCGQTPPTVATGLGPRALALDPARHLVYTANLGDATSSVIRGARCNATNPAGCSEPARRVAIGDLPTDVTFDPTTGTVYTADAFAAPPATSARGIVSVFGSS